MQPRCVLTCCACEVGRGHFSASPVGFHHTIFALLLRHPCERRRCCESCCAGLPLAWLNHMALSVFLLLPAPTWRQLTGEKPAVSPVAVRIGSASSGLSEVSHCWPSAMNRLSSPHRPAQISKTGSSARGAAHGPYQLGHRTLARTSAPRSAVRKNLTYDL
jgi:hypothetical protein